MRFFPTHEIKFRNPAGNVHTVEVMLVGGCGYTEAQWHGDSPADWKRNRDGNWIFRDEPTPVAQIPAIGPRTGTGLHRICEVSRLGNSHLIEVAEDYLSKASILRDEKGKILGATFYNPDNAGWHATEANDLSRLYFDSLSQAVDSFTLFRNWRARFGGGRSFDSEIEARMVFVGLGAPVRIVDHPVGNFGDIALVEVDGVTVHITRVFPKGFRDNAYDAAWNWVRKNS